MKINNSSVVESGFQEVLSLLKNLSSDQLVLTVCSYLVFWCSVVLIIYVSSLEAVHRSLYLQSLH